MADTEKDIKLRLGIDPDTAQLTLFRQNFAKLRAEVEGRGLVIPVRLDTSAVTSATAALQKQFTELKALGQINLGLAGTPATGSSGSRSASGGTPKTTTPKSAPSTTGGSGTPSPGPIPTPGTDDYASFVRTFVDGSLKSTELTRQLANGVRETTRTLAETGAQVKSTFDTTPLERFKNSVASINREFNPQITQARAAGNIREQIRLLADQRRQIDSALSNAANGIQSSPFAGTARNQSARLLGQRNAAIQIIKQQRAREIQDAAKAELKLREDAEKDFEKRRIAQQKLEATDAASRARAVAAQQKLEAADAATRARTAAQRQREIAQQGRDELRIRDAAGREQEKQRVQQIREQKKQENDDRKRTLGELKARQRVVDDANRTFSAGDRALISTISGRTERGIAKTGDLAERATLLRKAADEIQAVGTQAQQRGDLGVRNQAIARREALLTRATRIENKMSEAVTKSGHNFQFHSESLLRNAGSFARWTAAATTVTAVVGAITTGFLSAVEAERQTATLGAVFRSAAESSRYFGDSLEDQNRKIASHRAETRALADDALALAVANGVASEEGLDAAVRFARVGFTRRETLLAADVALRASTVSDVNAATAAEQLTAIYETQNLTVSGLNSTLNRLNELSNRNRTTVADLLGAYARVTGSAAQAGLSMGRTEAILARTIAASGRTGTVIGNATKTIFTNLARPETQNLLTDQFGIQFTDQQTGQLRAFEDVLTDIGLAYNSANTSEQRFLANRIAGARQVDVFNVLMAQLGPAMFEAAAASSDLDSALDEQAAILATTSAQAERLGAAWDRMWNTILTTGGDASLSSGIQNVLKGITAAISGLAELGARAEQEAQNRGINISKAAAAAIGLPGGGGALLEAARIFGKNQPASSSQNFQDNLNEQEKLVLQSEKLRASYEAVRAAATGAQIGASLAASGNKNALDKQITSVTEFLRASGGRTAAEVFFGSNTAENRDQALSLADQFEDAGNRGNRPEIKSLFEDLGSNIGSERIAKAYEEYRAQTTSTLASITALSDAQENLLNSAKAKGEIIPRAAIEKLQELKSLAEQLQEQFNRENFKEIEFPLSESQLARIADHFEEITARAKAAGDTITRSLDGDNAARNIAARRSGLEAEFNIRARILEQQRTAAQTELATLADQKSTLEALDAEGTPDDPRDAQFNDAAKASLRGFLNLPATVQRKEELGRISGEASSALGAIEQQRATARRAAELQNQQDIFQDAIRQGEALAQRRSAAFATGRNDSFQLLSQTQGLFSRQQRGFSRFPSAGGLSDPNQLNSAANNFGQVRGEQEQIERNILDLESQRFRLQADRVNLQEQENQKLRERTREIAEQFALASREDQLRATVLSGALQSRGGKLSQDEFAFLDANSRRALTTLVPGYTDNDVRRDFRRQQTDDGQTAAAIDAQIGQFRDAAAITSQRLVDQAQLIADALSAIQGDALLGGNRNNPATGNPIAIKIDAPTIQVSLKQELEEVVKTIAGPLRAEFRSALDQLRFELTKPDPAGNGTLVDK